jgi:hypothetical protein
MLSPRLSLRITPELERRIHQRARVSGRRPSAVVREALEHHFIEQGSAPSCYDLVLKAGVIGCAADAPLDLSTNRKYFEGFGGR